MKRIILLAATVLLITTIQAQKFSFTGKYPIKVQEKTISGEKVDSWDAAAADLENNIDLEDVFVTESYLGPLQKLGSSVNGMTMTMTHTQARDNNALTDGRIQLIPVYFTDTTLINTIKLPLVVQGNYTGDYYNGIGLYSLSGGTLTLRASSANDSEMWKSSAYSLISKNLTTPYLAPPGLYYVAVLYNSSSQTTAPTLLGSNVASAPLMSFDFTGNKKLSGSLNAQATLPAIILLSGTATSSFIYLTWTF